MDERERMLAAALCGLCGLHVGMVTSGGAVVVLSEKDRLTFVYPDGEDATVHPNGPLAPLPALDSPANWGHWLEWLVQRVDPADVDVYAGGPGWSACISPCATCEPERLPDALLRAYVEWCKEQGIEHDLPPSVLAWWEHEQALQMPVEPSYGVIMTAEEIAEQAEQEVSGAD